MVTITRRRTMHCNNNQKPSPPLSTTTTKFRYVWPVRIRTCTLNDHEHIIYNVSPTFSTVANSIAFSWTLRLCSEYTPATGSTTVNVFLYYLDGPRDAIAVRSASISLVDSSARRVLIGPMHIDQHEWRTGSGWSTEENHRGDRERFSEFVLDRVGKSGVMRLAVDIEMDTRAFDLFEYFPTLSRASIEPSVVNCAETLIREIRPADAADANEKDPFVIHRNVLAFGCKRLQEMQQRRKDGEPLSTNEKQALQTVFTFVYFNDVVLADMEYFEDFVDLIRQTNLHHLPDLKRECERFLCVEVISNKTDNRLVKEMILLAERYSLSVLRMIAISLLAETKQQQFETFIDDLAEIDQRLQLASDRQIFVRLADEVGKFADRSGRVRRQ